MLDVKMATKARNNLEKKLHLAQQIHNGSIVGDSWLLISYLSGAHSSHVCKIIHCVLLLESAVTLSLLNVDD